MTRVYTSFFLLVAWILSLATAIPTAIPENSLGLGYEAGLSLQDDDEDSELSTRGAAKIISHDVIAKALASPPNTSWFWTGRKAPGTSDKDSVMDIAGDLAKSKGGATLEQRLAKVAMPQFGTSDEARATWKFAAGLYAQNAAGDVNVVIGGSARPRNTWTDVEFPALKAGGKVNCVFVYSEKSGFKTPDLLWATKLKEALCKAKLNKSHL
jgi:hypothetical protein